MVRPKQNICVFQVSRPYLSFCPDPKHFIVNCEQNVVKFAEKWGKMNWKMQFLYQIFWQNKMLCRPTIPSFFRAETWNTHIYFLFGLMTCKIANEQRNSHIKCCKYADGLVKWSMLEQETFGLSELLIVWYPTCPCLIALCMFKLCSMLHTDFNDWGAAHWRFMNLSCRLLFTYIYMSHVMRKPVRAICKQQRRRSACTSAQSDQRLCCSLPR